MDYPNPSLGLSEIASVVALILSDAQLYVVCPILSLPGNQEMLVNDLAMRYV